MLFLVGAAVPALLCLRHALGVQSVKLPTLQDTGKGVTLFDYDDHVYALFTPIAITNRFRCPKFQST